LTWWTAAQFPVVKFAENQKCLEDNQVAQNSIYRLTYVQALNDVRFSNVIAFRQTSANSANDPRNDLADAFVGLIGLELTSRLSDQWSERCVQIREVSVAGQDFWRQLATQTGLDTGEPLPSEVCAQIKLFTDTPGRGNTGRMFFSGVPHVYEEDNCLTEYYMGQWQPLLDLLTSELDDGGATFEPGLLKGNGSFLPFTSGVIKSALTVQRSRKQSVIC
jgi:hypothetical protein